MVIVVSVLPLKTASQCLPVARYPLNGNANDYSGNGNHGQLNGEYTLPQPAQDRFGNYNSAYSFGGMNDKNWIEIPNSATLQFNQTLSVSLWFKQCSFSGMDGFGNLVSNGYFILLSKAGDGYAADPGFWCWTHTSGSNELEISFNNKNGNSNASLNFMETATYNCFDSCEWMNMVVVINYDQWQMYLNGELVKQITIDTADFSISNQQNLYIGRMHGSSTIWYPFYGVIDDVSLYNCALNQQEIANLYANYSDPLSSNNKIIIDTIIINPPSCTSMYDGSIEVVAQNANSDWLYSADGGVSFQSSAVFSQLPPGNYPIIVQSTCTTLDTTIILNLPVYNNISLVTLCNGMNYQLPGGNTVHTQGIYIDSLLSSLGCDSIIITQLSFTQDTIIYIDTTICPGKVYILPSGNIVQQGGIYSDTLISSAGCDSIIVIELTYFETIKSSIINNPVSCYSRSDGSLLIAAADGFPPYQYSLGNTLNSTGAFNDLTAGNYTYKITDSKNCSSEGQVIITEPEKVKVTIHPGKINSDYYNIIQLNAECNYSDAEYIWYPEKHLTCSSCSNPELQIMESVVYSVTAKVLMDQHYCYGEAELPVIMEPQIYLPNSFSPNNDGINDYFGLPEMNYQFNNFSVTIFNRWGEKIFTSGNTAFKWDGNFKGKKENGNYIYILKYSFNQTEHIKSGSIQITD